MSNEIISVINTLCDKLGIAVDWTAENVMPQVQYLIDRYARYLLVDAILDLVFALTLTVIGVIVSYKSIKAYYAEAKWACTKFRDTCYATGVFVAVVSFAIIGSVLGCVWLSFCVSSLIKTLTIPEIYAAQELIKLISGT